MSKVAINTSTSIKEGIHGALDLLDDLTPLLKGKYVAIKPNDTWASEDDTSACTQADSVEAVIQYIKQYGPSRIVVTGGSGAAETDEVFALLGIDEVIRKEGVEFFDHNRPPFESVALDYGPQKEVKVNPHIFEYEVLVSLAQHKVHYDATVTLTMKNIAMSFPAADFYGHPRGEQKHRNYFYRDIHGFIAGMCRRFPIDLGIIVGHPAMVNNGPIGGLTFESEIFIASTDFVAVDSIGAKLLGFEHVTHIEEADGLGSGVSSLDKIQLTGLSLTKAQEIFNRQRDSATEIHRKPSGVPIYSHGE